MAPNQAGSPFSGQIRQNAQQRGNVPSGASEQVRYPGHPEEKSRLWIVDRILEAQTVPHFFQFLFFGNLPGGALTNLPRPSEEECQLMMQPYAMWAPAPFNRCTDKPIEQMMTHIGSFEDGDRLVGITKELHSFKSRWWEGIVPLSERSWQELALDNPENFHAACQYLASTTNVFHYLNLPGIKANMRETYNRIYAQLEIVDRALSARRAAGSGPSRQPTKVTALWHDFIEAHYTYITTRAHRWVIEHIDRLRAPVLDRLTSHVPANPGGPYDEIQWTLTNKLHDLLENGAHADYAIFMPMDGYKGGSQGSQDDAPFTEEDKSNLRQQPITAHANTQKRAAAYYGRLKYLTRVEAWTGRESTNPFGPGGLNPTAFGDPSGILGHARSQVRAQERARAELRGTPAPVALEMWVDELKYHCGPGINPSWGYIAYRTCHDHSNEEWANFKAKFEADLANWGHELGGISAIKQWSRIEWRDARDAGVEDGNIDGLKKHFNAVNEAGETPGGFHDDIFLVADKAAIESYLGPSPRQGGFILAIDADFNLAEAQSAEGRLDESPGYDGSVRILSSLLWDDLGAMLIMQTQHLQDIWPLAMHHPLSVYEGPLIAPRVNAWRILNVARDAAVRSLGGWKEQAAASGGSTSTS